jgi:hypothetical protein
LCQYVCLVQSKQSLKLCKCGSKIWYELRCKCVQKSSDVIFFYFLLIKFVLLIANSFRLRSENRGTLVCFIFLRWNSWLIIMLHNPIRDVCVIIKSELEIVDIWSVYIFRCGARQSFNWIAWCDYLNTRVKYRHLCYEKKKLD